jgi:hypothetical protein
MSSSLVIDNVERLGSDAKVSAGLAMVNGRIKDADQGDRQIGKHVHGTKIFTPLPTNAFQGTEVQSAGLQIQTGDLDGIRQCWARIKVNISGLTAGQTVNVLPAEQWLSRLEIRSVQGDNLLQVFYGDCLWALGGWVTSEQYGSVAENCYHTDHWSGRGDGFSNGTLDAYIRLSNIFTEGFREGFMVSSLNSGAGLEFRFFFRASIVSSTSGTPLVTLTNLELHTNMLQANRTDTGLRESLVRLGRRMRATDFLDQILVSTTSNTAVNVSANNDFNLDALQHRVVSGILVGVRASSVTVANQQLTTFLDLGPSATLDILDPTGTTILGINGLTARFCKNCQMPDGVTGLPGELSRYTNLYLINFSRIPRFASRIQAGTFGFPTTNYTLRIIPDTVQVPEIQTITLSGVPTSGFYKLFIGGSLSANLAYNDNVTTMANAFNAIPYCLEYPGGPLTATFSAPVSGGTSLTVTFGGQSAGQRHPPVTIIPNGLVATATPVYGNTATTTFPTAGWVNGSNYNVMVYALCLKTLVNNNGVASAEFYICNQ